MWLAPIKDVVREDRRVQIGKYRGKRRVKRECMVYILEAKVPIMGVRP